MTRLAAVGSAFVLAVSTLFAVAPVENDPAILLDQRIITEVKERSEVLANLTHVSDEIGPRLTGSPALNKASTWATEVMKRYGLVNVHLEPWTIPEGWERGKAVARVIEPDNGRSIILASMGWYPGTKGKIQGDVVVITAESTKDLAQYKGKLKGAIVLASPPVKLVPLDKLVQSEKSLRAFEPRPGENRPRPDMMAFRTALRDFLQKEEAAALFLDSPKPFDLLVTTGSWQGKDRPSASNRLPTLYVAHNHYEMLYRLGTRPAPAKTRIELEVSNKFIPGPVKVYNAVGEIKGREKPDEFVILGAHLDSWDLGQGTLDNGTGSCVVLETARALSKCGTAPKRSIRFILFSGEEQGLHGSRYHVENNKAQMDKVSACMVHDTGTGRIKGLGTGGRTAVQTILKRELSSLAELGVKDFTTPSGGGSDHQSFSRVGVPAFMMVQEPAGYVFAHHTQADTLDAAKIENLVQGAQVMAVSAMRIANLPEMLPRGGGKK